MTAPDADLLRLTAAGDEAAFEAFVARHERWLHRHARAVAGPGDADEVLQEAFIAAWRAAAQFTGGESARGWLAAIARHAAHRRFRRHVGEPASHESLDQLAFDAGWGAEPARAAEDRAVTRDAVMRALERLSPDEREAIVLRDVDGFTAEEAATAAGVTVAALKSRLHRGRLRLAAFLKESFDA